MPTFDIMPIVRRWLSQYPYASAVLGTLAIVTLLVGTNGFAGLRQAVHTIRQRAEDRQLAREDGRYVWCYSHYTNSAGHTVIYGYWPGYPKQQILRAYDTPTWLLALPQHHKECFSDWRQAAEATDRIATESPSVLVNFWLMPGADADDETYRLAVLKAVLDAPITSYRNPAATEAEKATADRWCMSRLHTSDYTIYHVPHQVGGREAVEAVLKQLPDRSYLDHYRIEETACFVTDADARGWMKQSGFHPPKNSTATGYIISVLQWLGKE